MLATSFRFLSLTQLPVGYGRSHLSLQGTLFYTVFKGDKIAETLNQLGFGSFSPQLGLLSQQKTDLSRRSRRNGPGEP